MRLLALPILTVAVLVPTACGDDGDGDGATSADREQITEAIDEAATSTDPSVCTELQTERFNEQLNFEEGSAATEQCEEDTGENRADSVDVAEIGVDGNAATAEAAISGGGLDGQTLGLELVKAGEQWKLDQITDFVELDREALNAAFTEMIEAEGDETPEELRECIVDEFESFSDQEVEDLYLSGDPEETVQAFSACFEE